jgi:hypothetical protein
MTRRQSNELRVAQKIADLLSDLRLDIEMVGIYLGDFISNVTLSRAIIMIEAAEEAKEQDGIQIYKY